MLWGPLEQACTIYRMEHLALVNLQWYNQNEQWIAYSFLGERAISDKGCRLEVF